MAELLLHNLTKRFGRQAAVDGMDLHVQDGELLVLVGPSGCGKTTTLRLIAGLTRADAGRIRIGSRDVERLPPRARRVAMVFQELALFPHRSVRGNLALGRAMRGSPRGETRQRVQQVAELLGIEELLSRRPGQLSGGQQQRVALGRALVSDAEVLLLDEPFSDLDPRLRMRLRTELVDLQARLQRTIVHVTHDQVEAMMVGQRIAVMRAGRLEQVGSPLDVYHRPENRFVAAFLGSQPMNFLRGRLLGQAERIVFSSAGPAIPLPDAWRERCRPWRDRPVELGVRPEDVQVGPGPAAGGSQLSGVVRLVQPMGSQNLLSLDLDGVPFVACADVGAAARVGSRIPLSLPGERLHLFDPESGRRI